MRLGRYSALAASLLAAAFVGACASGGSGVLSSTSLTAEDLATANYETVYDFLRAHSRARIVSVEGNEALLVYSRGGSVGSATYDRPVSEFEGGRGGGGGSDATQQTGSTPGELPNEALLIIDDREFQGNVTQMLQSVPLSQVQSLKILRPSETSARYGGDGRKGAVVLVMKGSDSGQ